MLSLKETRWFLLFSFRPVPTPRGLKTLRQAIKVFDERRVAAVINSVPSVLQSEGDLVVTPRTLPDATRFSAPIPTIAQHALPVDIQECSEGVALRAIVIIISGLSHPRTGILQTISITLKSRKKETLAKTMVMGTAVEMIARRDTILDTEITGTMSQRRMHELDMRRKATLVPIIMTFRIEVTNLDGKRLSL